MRRRITLYINGKPADTDNQSFILFNYTKDEASNPTIVKNSYSQTVTLPGTAANDLIFNCYFRADRTTDTEGTGGFDALARNPFVIYDEMSQILESGYCKLTEVKTTGLRHTYSVQLFGGLGGFFYSLMYNEDGSKKTLANMQFEQNQQMYEPIYISCPLTASVIAQKWQGMKTTYDDGNGNAYQNIVNFAPCYNGLPACKFSADKAVAKLSATPTALAHIPNLYDSKDGYGTKDDAEGHILLELEKEHTEFEMQDLRAYLMRPVLNIWKFLVDLSNSENTGEYTLHISDDILTEDNDWMNYGWMTLPMFDRDNIDPTTATLADVLKGTASPAEYLISFAKVFGWEFIMDPATKTITVDTRNNFYDAQDIDLSQRIAKDGSLNPHTMESKNYNFGFPNVFGANAEAYAEKYGRDYGSRIVNTGYDFNDERIDVFEGICLNGAADVLERSGNFAYYGGNTHDDYGSYDNYYFKFAFSEKVTWRLYQYPQGDDVQELTCEPSPVTYTTPNYFNAVPYADMFPKVQLHDADNGAESGEGVLLMLNGFKAVPNVVSSGHEIAKAYFHLSDDTAAMLALNDGQPCWDVSTVSANTVNVDYLPMFRRCRTSSGVQSWNFNFGDPAEIWTGESLYADKALYHNFWKALIADKYNRDTKIVTRKVNFDGIQVDASLLRHFYYFEGSFWVLNKIKNYSLTTYDLTECEFIKIQDKNNYGSGQIFW